MLIRRNSSTRGILFLGEKVFSQARLPLKQIQKIKKVPPEAGPECFSTLRLIALL